MKLNDFKQALGNLWKWDGYNHHFTRGDGSNQFLIFIAPNLVEDKLGVRFCIKCICCNNITTACNAEVKNIQEFQTLLELLKDFK